MRFEAEMLMEPIIQSWQEFQQNDRRNHGACDSPESDKPGGKFWMEGEKERNSALKLRHRDHAAEGDLEEEFEGQRGRDIRGIRGIRIVRSIRNVRSIKKIRSLPKQKELVTIFLDFLFHMRFRCSTSSLQYALDVVTHVIDTNVTLPVLNNILIRAQGKKVHFSATNLEMAINYWMEAEVVNEGAVTVPAKLFSGYVNLLTDDQLECKVIEGLTLAMNSGGSKTKIKCIAAEEFPTISGIEEIVAFDLKRQGLPEAINQVIFATSPMNTRPALAGVFLKVSGKKLIMAATDSFRLSEKTITLPKAVSEEAQSIVPTRAMSEIARLCGKEEDMEKIKVTLGKNQIFVQIGQVELYSRLIEGNFPNYHQILPRSIRTTTSLDTEDQALAVKRINLFARENNNKVLFDFQKDKLKISTPATQVGEEEGETPITLEGDPGTIALNSEFVLDILSHVGADKVEIGMNDSKSPAVFKPVGKDDFVHIIMPLKL